MQTFDFLTHQADGAFTLSGTKWIRTVIRSGQVPILCPTPPHGLAVPTNFHWQFRPRAGQLLLHTPSDIGWSHAWSSVPGHIAVSIKITTLIPFSRHPGQLMAGASNVEDMESKVKGSRQFSRELSHNHYYTKFNLLHQWQKHIAPRGLGHNPSTPLTSLLMNDSSIPSRTRWHSIIMSQLRDGCVPLSIHSK